jgi:uracil-DNA glycosylase
MLKYLDISWFNLLELEFKKPYFKDLMTYLDTEYQNQICFPKETEIFAAFNHCSFDNIKVVIIGQDPYHGDKQANGLCFSVNEGVKFPPSLLNIFKEIEADMGVNKPSSGDLIGWAKQGVLLLNTTLTVRKSEAGSHQKKGWEIFTDEVIRKISDTKVDIIFLLWGSFAQTKRTLIDTKKHYVLSAGHPSPLSANRGLWFGNKHFSKTNEILISLQKEVVIWGL